MAELGAEFAKVFSSDHELTILEVICYAQVGFGLEVYPSEELILDKTSSSNKGKKSKVLYQVNEIAAMHSQKIGNALRTVDTWFPEAGQVGPIAAEVYGAVTSLGKAYRGKLNDFYTLFDNWANGNKLPTAEDEHYVASILVRGGVFGESDK